MKTLCLKISRWLEAVCLLRQNTGKILRGKEVGLRDSRRLMAAKPQLAHPHSPAVQVSSKTHRAWSTTLLGSLQLFPACGHLSSSPELLPSPEAPGSWLLCASAATGLASDSGARHLTPKATWRRSLIHQVQRMPGLWPRLIKHYPQSRAN